METTTVTEQHPSVALLHRAHQAFVDGDHDAIRQIFVDDIVWTIPGRSVVSGVQHGLEEVVERSGEISDMTDGTYQATGVDYLGTDTHAVALTRVRAARNGRTLDVAQAVVFDVVDGKLANGFHVPFDQHAWDEFFGEGE